MTMPQPPFAPAFDEYKKASEQDIAYKLTDLAVLLAYRLEMTPWEVLTEAAKAGKDAMDWETVRTALEIWIEEQETNEGSKEVDE